MNKSKQIYRLGDISAPAFIKTAGAKPVILLPLGSHEDHGPHLPMGDYLLADALAIRIAEAASVAGVPTYVAPCLPFGAADFFGSSPGGLAISPNGFRTILNDLLAGLLRHGLTDIVILNGHGGNVPVIHEVTLEIRRQRDGLIIPSFYLWKIARQLMERSLGPDQQNRFGHGAEPLLSLSLALRGGVTRWDTSPLPMPGTLLGLAAAGFGALDFQGLSVEAPLEFDMVPPGAIEAAAPLASAELGAEIADALVGAASDFVVHFAKVASISGVSKSRSTESVSTGTSTTASM